MQKHFHFLLFLFLCFHGSAFAQTVTQRCWDFEESCGNHAEAFRTGCIPNAISTHGSPDTKSDYNGITAPNGARYATARIRYDVCPPPSGTQWVPTWRGEGFALEFNFMAGVTYVITFKARTTSQTSSNSSWFSKCDLFLTNNLTNGGGLENPASSVCQMQFSTPPPPQPPAIGMVSESAGWVNYSFPVTPATNFTQLWFRPDIVIKNNTINSQGNNFFHFDNVCVSTQQTVPPCTPLNFSVNLCQFSGTEFVKATISGPAAPPAVPQASFALYPIKNCAAGFAIGNAGPPVPITWTSATTFNLPANSGCYALVYLSNIPGCELTFVSQVINTNGVNVSCPEGNCDGWNINVYPTPNDPTCLPVVFAAEPVGSDGFPQGTVVTATMQIQGAPGPLPAPVFDNQVEINYLAPRSSVTVCFTVQKPGCPAITKCLTWTNDCKNFEGRSVQSETALPIKISNPANQTIRLNTVLEEGSAQLFNLYGALIKSYVLNQSSQLDVSEVPDGQYVLSVQTPQGRSAHKVLIMKQ
jgi:hypothetical protein